MVAIALGLGFGLSWYALTDGRYFGAAQIGPWAAWPRAGLPSPDPYTRAYLARTGALQLGAAEGVQFVATTDSDGQPLDRNCRYRIDGTTPISSFWTMVPVAPDGTLIAPVNGPTHFESARLARAKDGSVQAYIGKPVSPLNWLEITGEGAFQIELTLYDTTAFTGAAAATTLPAIIREGCA